MEKSDEKLEKFDRRGKSKNINKLRNLPQYRNKSEEELEKMLIEKETSFEQSKEFEIRIETELGKFQEDYDLSDLKINDRAVLRNLVQSIIALEDYEQQSFQLRKSGLSPDNALAYQKMQDVMSTLRNDISRMQNDLSITRKHRKSDQETSVLAYIDSLKEKARKFIESRQSYIFCDKCNTLLGTAWFLFPNEKNEVLLICKQKDKDGNPCNNKVRAISKDMLEKRGTNRPELLPDSMK